MTKKNTSLIIIMMLIAVLFFYGLSHWVSKNALNVDEVTHQVTTD